MNNGFQNPLSKSLKIKVFLYTFGFLSIFALRPQIQAGVNALFVPPVSNLSYVNPLLGTSGVSDQIAGNPSADVYIEKVARREVERMAKEGRFRGEQGPKGDKGEPGALSGEVAGAFTDFPSTPAPSIPQTVIPGGVVPPNPSTGFPGATLLAATDLSAKNFTATTGTISNLTVSNTFTANNLNVSGSFSAPQLTTAERDALVNPTAGLLIFNTTTSKYNVYDGTQWKSVGSTAVGGDVESGTQGSVLFVGSGGLLQQNNSNFFWDNTNARLGIGTSSPSSSLTIAGDITATSAAALVSGFTTTTVVTPTFSNPANRIYNDQGNWVAVGSDGFARLVYIDETYTALKFVRCTNLACTTKNITTIETNSNGLDSAVVRMGNDGFARIAYINYDTPNALRYVRCTNADCSTNVITSVTTASSLYEINFAIGSNGFARIVFNNYTTHEIGIVNCGDADCSTKTISTIAFNYGSAFGIGVASDGFARFAYYENTPTKDVYYVQCTNASCSTYNRTAVVTLASGFSYYTNMVLSSSDLAYITVNHNTGLMLVQCTNASCSTNVSTVVDSSLSTEQGVPVMGTDGFPRIAYHDYGSGSSITKLIICTNASCSTKNTITLSTVDQYPTSVAMGTDGFARVVARLNATGYSIKLFVQGTTSGSDELQGSDIGTSSTPFASVYTTKLYLNGSELTPPIITTDSAGVNALYNSSNTGTLTSWTTNSTSLPTVQNEVTAVYANGYIYLAGNGANANPIRYAKVNSDGSVGSWTAGTALPQHRSRNTTIVLNGYIYIIGGGDSFSTFASTVYYAKLKSDGSIGTWTTSSNALPGARKLHTSVTANGYIYVIGGESGSGTRVNTVYYAKQNADGSTGAWTATTSLPTVLSEHNSIVSNGYLYVIGGNDGTGYLSTIRYARLNADGTIGSWNTNSTGISVPRGQFGNVVVNGKIYVMGGGDASTHYTLVEYAQLNSDGTIGSFTTTTSLPRKRLLFGVVAVNGYIYAIGGWDGDLSSAANTVYYASVPRVKIAGAVDLLGGVSGALGDAPGDTGSAIYAGSLYSSGKLEVVGNTELWGGLSVSGPVSILTSSTGDTPILNIAGSTNTPIFSVQSGGNIGFGTSTQFGSGTGVLAIANATVVPTANPTGGGVLYVDSGALKYRGSSGTVTTVAAADYAEDMPFIGQLEMAEVVVVSQTPNTTDEGYNNLYVERATKAYDSRLAGVVSSFMNPEQQDSKTRPIALAGRVPVKFSLENGPVIPGDYLTSSATKPGYAMKATQPGMVIGKALQTYNESNLDRTVLILLDPTYFVPTVADLIQGNDLDEGDISALNLTESPVYTKLVVRETLYVQKDLIVRGSLEVGSSSKPAGITIYDTETGEAYCIQVKNGQLVNLPGKCGLSPQQPTQPSTQQVAGESTGNSEDDVTEVVEPQTPENPSVIEEPVLETPVESAPPEQGVQTEE